MTDQERITELAAHLEAIERESACLLICREALETIRPNLVAIRKRLEAIPREMRGDDTFPAIVSAINASEIARFAINNTSEEASVFLARVKRQGAAEELRAMAAELEAKAKGGAGVLAYRISANKCRTRADELEANRK